MRRHHLTHTTNHQWSLVGRSLNSRNSRNSLTGDNKKGGRPFTTKNAPPSFTHAPHVALQPPFPTFFGAWVLYLNARVLTIQLGATTTTKTPKLGVIVSHILVSNRNIFRKKVCVGIYQIRRTCWRKEFISKCYPAELLTIKVGVLEKGAQICPN